MTDPALLAKIDALPPDARARALAMLQDARTWAGELQAVDVEEAAGELHVTLRFVAGAFDFRTPAAR